MQAQHHRVCSLGEGITFFVVSEQKDGDSADNSAASSYGLMPGGAVTGTHFSRPFTAPDLAFLRHLLGPDEGVNQLVFIPQIRTGAQTSAECSGCEQTIEQSLGCRSSHYSRMGIYRRTCSRASCDSASTGRTHPCLST